MQHVAFGVYRRCLHCQLLNSHSENVWLNAVQFFSVLMSTVVLESQLMIDNIKRLIFQLLLSILKHALLFVVKMVNDKSQQGESVSRFDLCIRSRWARIERHHFIAIMGQIQFFFLNVTFQSGVDHLDLICITNYFCSSCHCIARVDRVMVTNNQ